MTGLFNKQLAAGALALSLVSGICLLPAHADQAAGKTCAAALNAEGQAIYAAALPSAAPGANLRDLLTSTTRSLVMNGQVGRATAKTSAEAAGKCLELARS